MRTFILLAALAAALPARADISDSGSLVIGGQGVIQGTMTVAGSAFSVGGSTFSVAGGSVTLGGRLNLAASGIKWADGTTSTTAGGGGSGNMTTTGANAVSGSISMNGGSTFTATQSMTTSGNRIIAGQGPVFSGVWRTALSTSIITAVSSTTFQMNFSSAARYEMYWSGSLTSASNFIRLRFGHGGNVDTGSNYSFSTNSALLSASPINQYNDSISYCRLSYENGTDYVSAGQPFLVRMSFKPTEADNSDIIASYEVTYHSTDRATQVILVGGCRYAGSAPVNVVQLWTDSGSTWKGTAEINIKEP